MATLPMAGARASRKYYPHPRFPTEIDALDVPEVYASIAKGNCLEPVYSDGACLVFSKTEKPKAGDFVAVWYDPDVVPDGEQPRQVKRLVSNIMAGTSFPYQRRAGDEVEPLVEIEMFNPPRRWFVRASKIIAIHKVIGLAISTGDGQAMWKPEAAQPKVG